MDGLVCPECGEDMAEIKTNVHQCKCGFTAEQLEILELIECER